MGDVLSIARDIAVGVSSRSPIMGYCPDQIADLPIKPMSDITSHYYLRFTTVDRPGVLAQIASVLGKYNISIQSMIQPERHEADSVPIVLMTHEACEADVIIALAEIDDLEIVQQPTRLIRVENELG
jgi:homoserine dehydrogenase